MKNLSIAMDIKIMKHLCFGFFQYMLVLEFDHGIIIWHVFNITTSLHCVLMHCIKMKDLVIIGVG